MSSEYYDYNKVRKQVLLAQQKGLCTFKMYTSDKNQKTTVKPDDWSADCKLFPCTKGWCEIILEIKIKEGRTRMVSIYYFVKRPIAYVWLYGTIFNELIKSNILNLSSLDVIKDVDGFFPDVLNKPCKKI